MIKINRSWFTRRRILRIAAYGAGSLLLAAIAGAAVFLWALIHYGRDLPDVHQLGSYEPPIITRIHAGDGSLITEFAREKRLFMPVEAMPEGVKNAFLAAEDKRFYEHGGFDYIGIVRAAFQNIVNVAAGNRLVGASTITQQVARNFLLTLDQRLDRKIKEAILAYRIEQAFNKNEILELYLNEIYLGLGSYGVAAVALTYFDKPLDKLTLGEMAYLAALPKGPNNYHPVRRHEAAVARRNWVIDRMYEDRRITREEARAARAEKLVSNLRGEARMFRADYFAEEVRRELYSVYGEGQLYEGGLSVRTTLEPRLQAIAERALKDGLVAYDRRHGWRGPVTRIGLDDGWGVRLGELRVPLGYDSWRLAAVVETRDDAALIGFEDESYAYIPFDEVKWARKWLPGEYLAGEVKDIGEVVSPGDVIVVESLGKPDLDRTFADFYDSGGEAVGEVPAYGLRQIPEVGGAIVAMDPHTGRVLAMVGGFDYRQSEFNRATQAYRQPGSAFKPFVYAAALDAGFTPSSLVLDAPFVMDQGFGQGKWKPHNSSNTFYGPSTVRLGMEKSRNLMTVRLAQYIGMDRVVDYAERFGVEKDLQPTLANALGAGETTLLKLTAGYAMFVNGGKRIEPTFIDRIQDRRGATVYRHDSRPCPGCNTQVWADGLKVPDIPDTRARVVDARTAYQIVNLLQGVVRNGTGRKVAVLSCPLAGKTGTSNDWVDGWFVGFSPDLAVGVFVGFDTPRSLGVREEGSAVAVPIFRDFMAEALNGAPKIPFRIPSGIRLVRVNAETGMPAQEGDRDIILEAFIPGTEPTGERLVLDGANGFMQTDAKLKKGTGGLY